MTDAFQDDVLARHYDPGAIERGVGYFEDGRVQLLNSEPDSINAVCDGSGNSSYIVRIRWSAVGSELVDECTCPLGGSCKHCVAAILTARRQWTGEERTGDTAWRRAFADLATDDEHESRENYEPLALEFTATAPRPSRYQSSTGPRLTLRPLRKGRSGRWVRTGASWSDVASPYGSRLPDVDPRQRAALRALAGSGQISPYGGGAPVPIEQLGVDVWHQLAHAVEVGVELVGAQGVGVVELSPTPANVEVDLVAGASGGATVSVCFSTDSGPVAVGARTGLIGTPPHGFWVDEGRMLRLFPLAAPLHPSVVKLVKAAPLAVPAADVGELLDVYVPALARHAAVGSSDGSLTITTSRFDGLVLGITRTALDAVGLLWSARYRRGERVERHPLHGASGHHRDRAAEAAAAAALKLPTHLLADLADASGGPRDLHVAGAAAITVLTEVVPWVEANSDVAVEIIGDMPALREATGDPLISLTVADTDAGPNDWFDLGVEVSIDGQVVDFATLFTALDRGDEVLVLPSGTWLRLDRPDLTRLRELIAEARGVADPSPSGVARLNRFQTSWWEELAGLGVVASQSARWADSVARMGTLTAPEPIAPPAGLDAELRPYQQTGFEWLAFLHRHRLGGILADDMGLGKTVQTIALCLHILERDPQARFLVVAPTSVVENWTREVTRFAPGVPVRSIKETAVRRGTTLADEIAGANIVVTSYALFRIEFDDYAAESWELLLLDEAQFVKNYQGKTYQCARRLDVATKIAITGTPLENSLMDLWALLSITAPGLFPDPKRFADTYRKPIESGAAPELLATLRRRVSPLMRRRTKDAVLTELPPKIEQIVEVELGARHARIYQTQLQRQRQKILGLVGDVNRNRFEILKSLTMLRQLALDPGLVDEAHDSVGSAKLDRLLDDLGQVVAEGHRALVFSQFTRYLGRLRTRLDDAGIDHAYLDGRTRRRDDAIARFKDGDAPVFVISLKAGGFGLNLTEADYCFILDPWWNPATEVQATDRAHRIGQENPVVVYRYVSTGTIEEKVMELKARKADLFSRVLDGEGALAGALTADDIRSLLDLT